MNNCNILAISNPNMQRENFTDIIVILLCLRNCERKKAQVVETLMSMGLIIIFILNYVI